MTDVLALFDRQARWQRSRALLSWPEKIRLAEAMRAAALELRRGASERPETTGEEPARPPRP